VNAAATRCPPYSAAKSRAASFIKARIAKGTKVHADESGAWDGLHERFEMKRINHKRPTALMVPAPIRLRNISAASAALKSAFTITLLARICSAMRRNRHVLNGDQVSRVAALAMKRGKSADFTGYTALCPTCRAVLGVLPDPDSIAEMVVERLSGKRGR
jgi:hypothetical protein